MFQERAQHIIRRVDRLASITEEAGMIMRRYGTAAAVEAGGLVLEWMREAGLAVRVDAIGNIRGRWESAQPGAKVLVLGSHIDTVVNAGRWDGPLGVLTAMDILEWMIADGRQLPVTIELIAFCDEEGVRFHTTYLGSKVVAGTLEAEVLERRDEQGIGLAEAIAAIGGDVGELAGEAIPAGRFKGYFELHIEQGPVLYKRDIPVAVVTAIAGQIRVEAVWSGMAGHAGTVPMDMRTDALCGAAEFVLEAEKLAKEEPGLLATVGKLQVAHSASNVIPGKVSCSVDIRSADERLLIRGHQQLRVCGEEIAARRGLLLSWETVQTTAPVACDEVMNALLQTSIEAAGYPVLRLVSGAGHDAVAIAAVAPVSMLFVRCDRGISHHPDEKVEVKDLAAAIEVAERFIHQLTKT